LGGYLYNMKICYVGLIKQEVLVFKGGYMIFLRGPLPFLSAANPLDQKHFLPVRLATVPKNNNL
jgi:hypothetical protein